MASVADAVRLTEQHRLAQLRIGATTVQELSSVWPLLDLEHLDATFSRWLAAVQRVVGPQRHLSAQLAAHYYSTFRTLELGARAGKFTPITVGDLDLVQFTKSMLVTGPVSIKSSLASGAQLARAAANANAGAAGAGMRLVLGGGRDTISRTVGADPRALGWARAASGRACAFCAMLASRGPVFSEATVDFEAHDHCSCSSEPVFREDQGWPAGSADYRDLYNEATADVPAGGDLINAFRRAHEARLAG